MESSPVEPLAGPLPMPMAICEAGLPFTGPISKRAYTVRGGGAGAGGAAAGEDGSIGVGQGACQ